MSEVTDEWHELLYRIIVIIIIIYLYALTGFTVLAIHQHKIKIICEIFSVRNDIATKSKRITKKLKQKNH